MNLRKFFNVPNKEHKQLIQDGITKLKYIANDIVSEENSKGFDSANLINSTCPNCGSNVVVNKIARVQGSSNITGTFSLFGGSLYGSGKIDTNEVNHCNSCGNEWKKAKWYVTITSSIICGWLNYIYQYNETIDNWTNKRTKEILQLLKDVPAESLYECLNEYDYSNKLYISTIENLSLKILRKYFKSVYDKN